MALTLNDTRRILRLVCPWWDAWLTLVIAECADEADWFDAIDDRLLAFKIETIESLMFLPVVTSKRWIFRGVSCSTRHRKLFDNTSFLNTSGTLSSCSSSPGWANDTRIACNLIGIISELMKFNLVTLLPAIWFSSVRRVFRRRNNSRGSLCCRNRWSRPGKR